MFSLKKMDMLVPQDRLKKEMMERVENVAGEFRKAAHSQMAATTQRTIRSESESP